MTTNTAIHCLYYSCKVAGGCRCTCIKCRPNTTTTNTITKIYTFIDLLAAATVACPDCINGRRVSKATHKAFDTAVEQCDTCQGTSQLPRFPGARRKCSRCHGDGRVAQYISGPPLLKPCPGKCNGTGEVPNHAVRIEALMADLTSEEALEVNRRVGQWFYLLPPNDPMPPAYEIRLVLLRTIVEVAEVG